MKNTGLKNAFLCLLLGTLGQSVNPALAQTPAPTPGPRFDNSIALPNAPGTTGLIGRRWRFPGFLPGRDAIAEVVAASGDAALIEMDAPGQHPDPHAWSPTLKDSLTSERSITWKFTSVWSGTFDPVPMAMDIKLTAFDVDGNPGSTDGPRGGSGTTVGTGSGGDADPAAYQDEVDTRQPFKHTINNPTDLTITSQAGTVEVKGPTILYAGKAISLDPRVKITFHYRAQRTHFFIKVGGRRVGGPPTAPMHTAVVFGVNQKEVYPEPVEPDADRPDYLAKPLATLPVPQPSNLMAYVADKQKAIALGKSLFWDMQVGSDGIQACASCHFHAGADNRSINQISPGLLAGDTSFQIGNGKPNYHLQASDYPFRKHSNVNDASSVISDANDITSSQGVHKNQFIKAVPGAQADQRQTQPDSVFSIGGVNVRRVPPRNSPTVINAIFNLRNFWDGRAQDSFNGVNPFGRRDPLARVVRATTPTSMAGVKISISNASLASQAVGPVPNDTEMAAAGREFPEAGRRLVKAKPLARQLVHAQDSVLGSLKSPSGPGLAAPNYETLIKEAFRPEWWQGTQIVRVNPDRSLTILPPTNAALPNDYSQMEYNFSLFFGLAVQLYEATLVSDQTPFDAYAAGDSTALTTQQRHGLAVFYDEGKCIECHGGSEFTKATVSHIGNDRIERMMMGDYGTTGLGIAVYDNGFYNIGVRPSTEDLGVGATDPFGLPLSESRLAAQGKYLSIVGKNPPFTVHPSERIAANGAFKTPTLRNVELTAPYFHNGGTLSLRQVVDFYNRGGDFRQQNFADLDADITRLGLSEEKKEALVAFMLSLTDERVRYRKAPFDHPQLLLPNGHPTGTNGVPFTSIPGVAKDQFIMLPPTGANGGTPLKLFLQ